MEELGIIGGIIILAILFFLISRMLIVGIRAKSAFNSLIMIGVSGLLLVQVFVNVGGAIGIIPETGVTFLPITRRVVLPCLIVGNCICIKYFS